MRPLEGVRVLDLGNMLMAPYAAQWLGDLGADVIKIEPPEGDTTRRIGPRAEPDMAAIFLGLNRNKRSVVLNLKNAAEVKKAYTDITNRMKKLKGKPKIMKTPGYTFH